MSCRPYRPRLRVGVFGGTFDPPHVGHAVAAADVLAAAGLDRILWIPVSIPPHKAHRTVSAGDMRRRLVEAAIRDAPRFELCDLELERGGVSYTVDTLRKLKADHPDWSLSLIVGGDLFGGFASWKEPEAIAELAEIIVIPRPGVDVPRPGVDLSSEVGGVAAAEGLAGRVLRRSRCSRGIHHGLPGFRTVPVTTIEVSSSRVRSRIGRNLAVRDMVAPAVLAIIEGEGLYLGSAPGAQPGRGCNAPQVECG